MSLSEYELSKRLTAGDPPFAALIMAALRKADTENAAKLRAGWPDICDELQARYNTPGGALPNDTRAWGAGTAR